MMSSLSEVLMSSIHSVPTVPAVLAADADEIVPVLAVGGGLVFGMVWMLAWMINSMYKTKQVERSRREIAAYIAEGTISPEDGVKLMTAKFKNSDEDE